MDRINFFRNIGFSEYESKVLSSFLRLGEAGSREISEDSGVPRNKLYNIFHNLEHLGLLAGVPSDVKKYRLINLDSFISKRIVEKENKLNSIKEASKNIELIKDREERGYFLFIKGQKSIMNKLVELNKNSKKEILGVQRNWKYWGEGIRAVESAIKNGADVKLIGVINKETEKRAKEWKNIGCKIKSYNQKFGECPLRFSIFDGKYARITIGKPEIKESKDYITILTDSKPLVWMLRNQFMQMWKECENF
jgi:sugar-specific transcriptional regulator TrmB